MAQRAEHYRSNVAKARQAARYSTRQQEHAHLYDRHWRANRAAYLADNPLCVHCLQRSLIKLATVVDHIKPHKGDAALFSDVSNWQSLCKRCHDRKTVLFDGGFGRGRQRRGGSHETRAGWGAR